ncbi:MAG TPA: glycosyltransferase family 1 protein [Candidatus Pacearchaeota archaeon]|nr:glycosyltransferase family 1 protein [Candidatus Pacearchaeota archaeon]HOK94137.1 glycosyltransferase family 1 protein [Candidatus Pacearchaeota archaeon]HPO75501.1 glycosyltransferase family 1 protein [Candidatus Pacearchaeota archaeon]
MKIAIDARVIERRMSGIGRYLLGFLEWLTKLDKQNQYFLFSYEGLPKFQQAGYKVIATGKNSIFRGKIYNFYWQEFILPQLLKKYKIDIFFNPNHYLPLRKTSSKNIITIHDLSHKIEKEYKSFIYRFLYLDIILPKSAKKSDLILTVSENSKKDILKYYFTQQKLINSANKIKVIYLAADEKFKPRSLANDVLIANIRQKYSLPEEFILYVGRIEKRKNIKGIIEIAKLLPQMKFVLVGESGYSGAEELIREIQKQKNIYHLEFVEEEDLPFIYNLGKIFLFPSFYEGFGLPVLEAMQSGLPVLTSNTSSLPEVVGDGGIMHSPDDYSSFSNDIEKLFKDNNFYQEMQKRALIQAKKFSWEKSTKEFISLINLLCQKNF